MQKQYYAVQQNISNMVTIGIPVYNCNQALISRCIHSVLNQTEEDIEMLIVNDCCTDDTMKYVEEAITNNISLKKVRIINHKTNTGIAGSRNTILEEAKGEYLYFMDCDDYIASDAIEKLIKKAKDYHAEVVWGSVMEIIYETNEKQVNIKYPDLALIGEDKLGYYANHDSNENIRNFIWNILMNTSFIRKNNLRFESYSYFDDYVFLNKMYPLVNRAVFISDITYYWVIRKGSQSHPIESTIPSYNIKQAVVANNVLKELCKTLHNKSYYEGYCLRLHKDCFFTAYTMVKHRKRLDYHFTNKDIKNILTPTAHFKEIIGFHIYKKQNLLFYFLGNMPSITIPYLLRLLNLLRKYKNIQ